LPTSSKDRCGGLLMKYRHQGMGRPQIEARLLTEKKIIDFLYEEQIAYLNQIVRGLGIKNKHSVISVLDSLIDKKEVKRILVPSSPKRLDYYCLQRIRNPLALLKKEKQRRLWDLCYSNHKKFLKLKNRQLFEAILEKPTKSNENSKLKKEILRLLRIGKKHSVPLFVLEYMIVYSETITTKGEVCKIFKITPQAFEANIKRNPELQQLRKNIRIETEKAKKKNVRLIPQWRDDELKVAWVKNSVAKKYSL